MFKRKRILDDQRKFWDVIKPFAIEKKRYYNF